MAFLPCPTPHPQTGRTCFGVAHVTSSSAFCDYIPLFGTHCMDFDLQNFQVQKDSERRFSVADNFHASFKQWCARIGSKTTWRTKHLRVHHQWQMPTKPCCQIISKTRCFWLAEKRAQPWEHHLQHPPDRQWHLDCLQSNMNRFCHQHHVFLMGKTIMS